MTEFLGKTIGQYQIVEFIGESGDTLVYKGFQPSMNRYVAVKMLKSSIVRDQASVNQFIQQAELLAKMQHPNILPVYDSGREEGLVYLISQYVEIGSLGDHSYEFSDPRKALNLVVGITEGLDYIHGQGYIHGNLKPANILLDHENRPLLSDFGFSRLAGAAITAYLSPEQVQGGVVDRRSDIYALGVLLYEMLVGETPPMGAVISPRAKRPDLPEAVEMVILKAMAQNPDQRFQTASDFRVALDAALRPVAPPPQPAPSVAPAPGPETSAAPPPQPQPQRGTNWLAIILGGFLIIVLCVGAFMIIPRFFGDQEPPPVEETAAPEPTEPPQEPTQPPVEPTEPPEEPPQVEQPIEPPPGEGGGILDQICGSIGFAGGAMLLGGVLVSRWRRTFNIPIRQSR